MTKQVQRRRGTATQHTSFTGAEGELSVNTTNKSVHVHDGSTAGGIELARKDGSNVAFTSGTLDGVTIGGTTAGAGTFTNLTATGTTTLAGASTSANITFGDNDKAIFGAGSDLQIYHDGSNSIIKDSGAGDLRIMGSDDVRIVDAVNEDNMARFNRDGAVTLYYDNVAKFATTSTGIDVTGTVTADGLTVDGDFLVNDSDATPIVIQRNGGTDANTSIQFDQASYDTYVGTGLTGDFVVGDVADLSVNRRFSIAQNNDISFYEDTGTTAKFFWDASAESLTLTGQKDSTALNLSASLVTVGGGTLADYNQLYFDNTSGTGDAYIRHYSNAHSDSHSALAFGTADNGSLAERMRIDSSGNVGIGTSSPAQKLHLNGAAENVHLMLTNSTTGSTTNDGLHLITETGTGNAYIIQRENANLIMHTNNTERMRIDSSGRVGIGTSSPASKIHIQNASGGSEGYLKVTDAVHGGDVRFGMADGIDNDAVLGVWSNNNVRFYTNSSEAMRIDSSGNLLVGKTSDNNATEGVSLAATGAVKATNSNDLTGVFNRLTSDGDIVIFQKNTATVGSIGTSGGTLLIDSGTTYSGLGFDQYVIYPRNSGAASDNLIDLGYSNYRFDDIYATNGTIQTSDENEKQQIASLTDAEITAAKAISKLFKTFKWNDSVAEKGDAARTHTGVIAQQVETAMTDAGLNAGDYAFFISSTWWETQTDVPAVEADEENGVEAQEAYTRTDTYHTAEEAPEGATERNRKGIRYPQLLSFVAAATEQRLASIETRLDALEE